MSNFFLCWRWERTDKDLALTKWNRKLGMAFSALHMENYRELSTFNIFHGRSSVCSWLITLKQTNKQTNPQENKQKKLFHFPVFEPRLYLLIPIFNIQQSSTSWHYSYSYHYFESKLEKWGREKLRMKTMKYVLFCASGSKVIYFGSDSAHNNLSVTLAFLAGNLSLL